jgi:hypothetical protein
VLLQQLADFARNSSRIISVSQLLNWIQDRVQQPGLFPLLERHFDSLKAYLLGAEDSPIDLLQKSEKLSAPQLFDGWMAWRTGLDPEQFRQKVSRIGSHPHKTAS